MDPRSFFGITVSCPGCYFSCNSGSYIFTEDHGCRDIKWQPSIETHRQCKCYSSTRRLYQGRKYNSYDDESYDRNQAMPTQLSKECHDLTMSLQVRYNTF